MFSKGYMNIQQAQTLVAKQAASEASRQEWQPMLSGEQRAQMKALMATECHAAAVDKVDIKLLNRDHTSCESDEDGNDSGEEDGAPSLAQKAQLVNVMLERQCDAARAVMNNAQFQVSVVPCPLP